MCLLQKFRSTEILNIRYLQETISFELQVGSKICNIVSLYWPPSQTSDGFKKFTGNFELTLDTLADSNSHLIVVLKFKIWYINDKTTTEDVKIEFVTSQYGLHQIINEPTHVLENSKLVSGFRRSSFLTLKLPSSNCACKI